MGINSTEVSYAFGQMGSVFLKDASAAITSNEVAGMGDAVFCAITFLEDTVFANAGLIAEDENLYVNSVAEQTKITASTSDNTQGEVFPKGVTIYGRFTKIILVSGKIIAYIGY